VRRILVDSAAAVAFFTVALVGAVVFRPGDWRLALDVWLLAGGGVALLAAVAATRTALPAPGASPFERRRRRTGETPEPLQQLARVEREVVMGTGTAFDAHYRLRPLLRDIAEHRLATRRGLELDSGSETVRALVGDELWELLEPVRPRPRRHHDPGVPLRAVAEAVDRLEAI
jgi:hypothetical protein